MTQECSDSRLEDLTGQEGDQRKKKKTYLFLHPRLMSVRAHTHTRSESPWLIEATLYQTDSSRSVGKHRKEGGEGYARKMKEGMEGNRKLCRGEKRSKRRKTQTEGEREKSLWHIVV